MRVSIASLTLLLVTSSSTITSSTAFQTPSSSPSPFFLPSKTNHGLSHGHNAASVLTTRSTITTPNRINTNSDTNSNSNTALNLAPLAAATAVSSSISGPIGSISVLAFVILIHEAGHFLAARSFGISVQEFSVGVGPKIAGFTRGGSSSSSSDSSSSKNDGTNDNEDGVEDGIEFNLRAIPLGGYVRFPENYNATVEFEMEREADSKRDEIRRIVQEQREKNGSSAPGGTSGGLLSSVRNFIQEDTISKEERVAALELMAVDLQKKESKNTNWFTSLFNTKKANDAGTERAVTIEEDGTVTVPPIEYYNDPDLLQNRPWTQRAVVLVGGVVFNILLAFSLYFGELTVGPGLIKPAFDQGAVVSSIPKVNGASVGILNRGDLILGINGKSISSTAPSAYEAQEAISDLIANIRATPQGESIHLSVLKQNSKTPSEIDIKPKPIDADDANSPLSIGVMIAPNFIGQQVIKADSVVDAVKIASVEVSDLTSQTATTILSYIGTMLSGGAAPAGQSLSGPIGVIKAGSDVVSTNNIAAVIGFAAAISINLAVVNSLPLPALDGGQLLFVMAEAVTGRKIDQRTQESVTAATLLFLLIVTFSTAVGDISAIAR